jgi:hypothetical protein
MARVHGIETDGFGLLDVRSVVMHPGTPGKGLQRNWQEYIMLNLEDHLRICCGIGVIDAEESLKISKCFDSGAPLIKNVSSSLLHGDLGHHNVFSDGTRITAIIDWEDCLCGDPAFDIAYWGTFHQDELLIPFLHGYRKARIVPDDFEERYWLYYLRIALAKTVHRYRFQYQDVPGRPPASLRIQKALNRVRALGLR